MTHKTIEINIHKTGIMDITESIPFIKFDKCMDACKNQLVKDLENAPSSKIFSSICSDLKDQLWEKSGGLDPP